MRKILILLPILAMPLAGCVNNGGGYNAGYGNGGYGGNTQPLDSAAIRTVGGAAAGALIAGSTGGSKTKGALIGAVAGGGSCMVPGVNNCY